ncbi:MAG: sensor protein, partial [Firmicutes bacterium]|nr:sensor protein [Bacillota bacterium]
MEIIEENKMLPVNAILNAQPSLDDSNLFYQFVEQIPVPIYILNETTYLYVNPALIKIMGYSWEEFSRLNWWNTVVPDMKDEIKERGLARLRGEPSPEYYELKVVTKYGDIIWAEQFYSTLCIGGQKYTIVGAYDITARKRAENELQKIQENLEMQVQKRTDALREANEELIRLNKNLNKIFQNMSDGVIVINEQGEVEILNEVLQKAWGPLLEEIEERLREIIMAQDSQTPIYEMVVRQQPFRDIEMIFPTSQGDIHCLVSGTPMRGERGKLNSTIFFIRPLKEVQKLVNRFSGACATFHFDDIVSKSDQMDNVFKAGYAAAASMSNVLIQGESGTGKELLAQSIHNHSERRNGPFVALNCGAIPRELIGSELFGYAEGAFTGAKKGGNPGKFELADGGTLFLDEIGDMPLDQQVTLLRVLQEKKVTRISGNRVVPVDVRFICATNKDLYKEVQNDKFRRDLFYRLNVIFIHIPRLQERLDDIPELFFHFLKRNTINQGLPQPKVQPGVIECLLNYNWPGNVRELENIVERLIYTSSQGDIRIEHLPSEIRDYKNESLNPGFNPEPFQFHLSARQQLDE